MSTDNINWIEAFSASIRRGEFPGNLSVEQFNDVLKWLIGREFEVGVRLTQEFSSFFSAPSVARDNTLYALDDMLFGGAVDSPFAHLGLSRNTAIGIVKSRYKRLMQVYHPDRSLATELGLVSRAETLNSAFSSIKEVKNGLSTASSKPGVTRGGYTSESVYHPSPATKSPPAYSSRSYPSKARVVMGSAQQAKRKILIGLAGLSCLFLLVIYINNRPLDSENTLIASNVEQGILAHKVTKNSNGLEVLPAENILENVNTVSRIAINNKQNALPTELEVAIEKDSTSYQRSYDESVSETTKTKEKLATVRKKIGKVHYFKLEDVENLNDLTVSVHSVASNDEIILDESKSGYSTDSFNLALVTKEVSVNPKEVSVNPKEVSVNPKEVSVNPKEVSVNPKGIAIERQNVKTSDTVNTTQVKAVLTKLNATNAVSSQVLNKDSALGALKKYVDGMYINDIDKVLSQVNDTVNLDNRLVSKAALRKTYSSWLDNSIDRRYSFTVKETTSSGNIFTVKGRASIGFFYKNKAKKRFNGPLTFDFKLVNNKPLIVAIRGK